MLFWKKRWMSCGGERKTRKEVNVTIVMKLKLLDGMECLYLFAVWKAAVWDLPQADWEIWSTVWQYWISSPSDTEQHVFVVCSCVSENPTRNMEWVNIYSLEQLLDVGTIFEFNQRFYFYPNIHFTPSGKIVDLWFHLLSLERTAH